MSFNFRNLILPQNRQNPKNRARQKFPSLMKRINALCLILKLALEVKAYFWIFEIWLKV